jgi:enamine deaminase RidA (YjgF/YER057c/UK114 family)
MPKSVYRAGTVFEEIYPHCKAVRVDRTLYVAGTGGVDYATGKWPTSAAEQTRLALANLEDVLRRFGMGFPDIVRCEVIYTSDDVWTAAMPIIAQRFKGVEATHIAFKAGLPVPEMLIEFLVTAWSDAADKKAG